MITYSRGFTLVETLVAISILTVSIVGPLYSLHTALTAANVARDRLIASSLAQEALEHVRSVRNDNYLHNTYNPGANRSWMYSLDTLPCYSGSTNNASYCTVDPSQNTVSSCGGSCAPLNMSPTFFYTQASPSGYIQTKFMRTLQIYERTVDNEVQATVIVRWVYKGQTYTVQISDVLRNWL